MEETLPKASRRVKKAGFARSALAVIGFLIGMVMIALIVVTPLKLEDQAIFGAFGFAIALILNRFRGRAVTIMLMLVAAIVSSRYMHWRLTTTLGGDWSWSTIMGPLLLIAEIYAYVVLLLGFVQTAWPLQRQPAPLPKDASRWPTVDVFIPTYNEPLAVVRATVLAAKAMDWPAHKLNVYLLDDGRRPEFREFAARVQVGYITRPDNTHAKAGNLNNALARTKGEFVAIFDCDHVPTRSFLQATMGWFLRDAKIAMVQTPHHFYSPDPFERNLEHFRIVPNEGYLFYGMIQPGNDTWNSVFFCGSCAVLRRAALDEVGGIAVETVTEDAHTALRMHRRGWRTAYIDIPQASGLATESLGAHIVQRIRWARGMAQIFRTDNPLFGRGLRLAQRLNYLNAMIHFLYAIPRLIFLTAPLSFLLFGAHIFNATPAMVIAYALPHLAHAQLANRRNQGQYRHAFWAEVYEAALSWYILLPTTLALINPRRGKFNVTAKGGYIEKEFFDSRLALPYLLLLLANLTALGFGLHHVIAGSEQAGAYLMNIFWASYNVIVLGAVTAVAWEKKQVRASNRIGVRLPAMLRLDNGHTISCAAEDLSLGGAWVSGAGHIELQPDDLVTLSVIVQGDEHPLATRVVSRDGAGLRLRFDRLSVEEESWLVQILYSRVDAWTGWRERYEPDRLLQTLFLILKHSLRGLGKTALLPFRLGRKGAADPARQEAAL